MHEYSLMENILEGVFRELASRGIEKPGAVQALHLTLGALEIHSRESFEQAFAVATRGTPLEGAALVLTVTPATLACAECGFNGPLAEGDADGHLPLPVAECPTCGAVTPVQGGRGVGPTELILNEA